MVRFNSKKFVAVIIAGTMTLGCSITALATDGTGTYEGNVVDYPETTVTLPTTATDAYNYIADPNGLIKASTVKRIEGATFTGDTGVYFKQKDGITYKNISDIMTVQNEGASSVILTCTLEQKEGDANAAKNVTYSSTNEFSGTNKELWLAITDKTNTAAVAADKAATMDFFIKGKPSNYDFGYNKTQNKYIYKVKSNASGWNSASAAITGAVNMDARWVSGDGDAEIKFPVVTVTWALNKIAVPVKIAAGAATDAVTLKTTGAQEIKSIEFVGKESIEITEDMYTFVSGAENTAGTITFKGDFGTAFANYLSGDGYTVKITYKSNKVDYVDVIKE